MEITMLLAVGVLVVAAAVFAVLADRREPARAVVRRRPPEGR